MKMDINMLISLVFKKPPVWDRRIKKHANRFVVDKCWREISAEMKEDENLLRKKWKYLRDQFAVEHGKIHIPRSGDEAFTSYEPKWPYYHSLLFLKDVVKPRKTSANVGQPLECVLFEEKSNVYLEDNPQDIQHNPSILEEDTKSNIELSRTSRAVLPVKRTNTFNQNMLEIKKKRLEYLQLKARRNDDDEHLLFLRSLLPHIRKIPQNRLLSFRNDIQRTVDIYAYQSQVPRPPSSSSSMEPVPSPTER